MLQLVNVNSNIRTQILNTKKGWIHRIPFGELKFKEINEDTPVITVNSNENMELYVTAGIGFINDHALAVNLSNGQISLTTNDLEERIINLESQVRTMHNIIDNLLRRLPDYAQPNFRF